MRRECRVSPQSAARLPHELRVLGALLSPQTVVQVGHLQADPQLVPHLQQEVEERHRIRPAGDRDQERVAGVKGTDLLEEVEDPLLEHA